jgi:hypothetical protein
LREVGHWLAPSWSTEPLDDAYGLVISGSGMAQKPADSVVAGGGAPARVVSVAAFDLGEPRAITASFAVADSALYVARAYEPSIPTYLASSLPKNQTGGQTDSLGAADEQFKGAAALHVGMRDGIQAERIQQSILGGGVKMGQTALSHARSAVRKHFGEAARIISYASAADLLSAVSSPAVQVIRENPAARPHAVMTGEKADG